LLFDGAADGIGGRGSRSSSEVERMIGGVGSDCDWRRIALGRGAGGGDVARIAAGWPTAATGVRERSMDAAADDATMVEVDEAERWPKTEDERWWLDAPAADELVVA
jgi:hypothetical protein